MFDFLYDQSLEGNRHFLDRYRGGDRRGVVFYAAANRHICVRDHLTAHPNKRTTEDLVSICDALADFSLALIRDDFGRRLKVARAVQAPVRNPPARSEFASISAQPTGWKSALPVVIQFSDTSPGCRPVAAP